MLFLTFPLPSHSVLFRFFTLPSFIFFIFLQLEVLRKELKSIKDSYDEKSVDSALKYVRQLLSRPPAIFDAFATLAALEQLSDLAREKGHERASRFAIILRQTRPLMGSPSFQ